MYNKNKKNQKGFIKIKKLFSVNRLTIEKCNELINEYVQNRVVEKLDDVEKLSVIHLSYGFEQFLNEKYDLPIKVTLNEVTSLLEPLMTKLGYKYSGYSSRIRFNAKSKVRYQYDKVIDTLNLHDRLPTVDQHRYFKKIN